LKKIKTKFDKKNKIHIYRIIQECLHNAFQHSEAKNVSLYLSEEENGVQFTIKDDGKGFDWSAEKKKETVSKNYGLMNIVQRAKFIGAELEIDSKLKKGTKIVLKIKGD
jgi:signal transduction histidine kinase